MRMSYVIIVIIISSFCLNAQKPMNLDIIIFINEELVLSGINNPKIEVLKNDSEVIEHDVYYHPGNLILDVDKEDLFNDETISATLKFDFFDAKKEESINYEIELTENWFLDYYAILHIFNLKCRKYRRRYKPLSEERNYTFEVDSPSHSFKRL